MQSPILCTVCAEAFVREHECDKSYPHHQNAASFHSAKKAGCHVCSVVWEVARGDPSDLKWDFRTARELNVTYEFSSSQSTIYFRLDADGGKVASLMSTLRPLDTVPKISCPELSRDNLSYQRDEVSNRVSKALSWSKYWLQHCLENHAVCRNYLSSASAQTLPTRVLDLRRYDEGKVFLHVTGGSENGPYMTLSHRWGVVNEPPKLLTANFEERQEGIVVSSFPKSFLDAMRVARCLGVDWLWIDSLCIIQDSEDDWRHESSLMGSVYQGSLCNLAATGASDSYGGFFPDDSVVASPLLLDLHIKRKAVDVESLFPCRNYADGPQTYRVEPWSRWSRKIEDAELNQRGWVMQERVLATRTLHFTHTEVFWECLENIACEAVPDSLSEYAATEYALIKSTLASLQERHAQALDGQLADVFKQGWQQLTHAYIKCRLTKENDRLIAISGISKLMQQATGDTYLAGNWGSTLFTDLVWYNMPDGERLARTRPLNAPTWSWASVRPYAYISGYSFPPPNQRQPVPLAEFVDYDADPFTNDETGQLRSAFLHLRGKLLPGVDATFQGFPTLDSSLDINGLRFVHSSLYIDEDDLVEAGSPSLDLQYLPILAEYGWLSGDKIRLHMLILTRESINNTFERAGLFSVISEHFVTEAEFDKFTQSLRELGSNEVIIG